MTCQKPIRCPGCKSHRLTRQRVEITDTVAITFRCSDCSSNPTLTIAQAGDSNTIYWQQRKLTATEQEALDWLQAQDCTRNPFLQGLQNQLRQASTYDSPLSPRQWECLLNNYRSHLRSQYYQRQIENLKRRT